MGSGITRTGEHSLMVGRDSMGSSFLTSNIFVGYTLGNAASIEGNLDGFAKGRVPARVGHPENGIFRWIRIRVAEQISEINQTSRINSVFFHPLEYRAEICSSAAFRLQFNRLGWPELLDALHCGVAIDHMNALRLYFIADRGYLAGKLREFFVANGS